MEAVPLPRCSMRVVTRGFLFDLGLEFFLCYLCLLFCSCFVNCSQTASLNEFGQVRAIKNFNFRSHYLEHFLVVVLVFYSLQCLEPLLRSALCLERVLDASTRAFPTKSSWRSSEPRSLPYLPFPPQYFISTQIIISVVVFGYPN